MPNLQPEKFPNVRSRLRKSFTQFASRDYS